MFHQLLGIIFEVQDFFLLHRYVESDFGGAEHCYAECAAFPVIVTVSKGHLGAT